MGGEDTIALEAEKRADDLLGNGRYEDALVALSEAAAAHERSGRTKEQAARLQTVAELYQLMRKLEEAEGVYHRLLDLYEGLSDVGAKATVLGNLGLLRAFSGDFQNALEYLHKAEAVFESLDDPLPLAQLWGNIGSVHRDRNEPELALAHYHRALQVFERLELPEPVADQCANIAYIHAVQNQGEASVQWFERALALYRKTGNEEKARLTGQNLERLSAK